MGRTSEDSRTGTERAPENSGTPNHQGKVVKQACGNRLCGGAATVCGTLAFGSGFLDNNGYWERPCCKCARQAERRYPEEKFWPFEVLT